MNKEEFKKYFLSDNKSGYKTREKYVIKNLPELYDNINSFDINNDEMKFNQKLYNYLYNVIKIPKCLTCSKEIKWRGVFTEGYKEYCNLQCGGKGKKRLDKIKKTNLNKYGVEYVTQSDEVKEIIIKNNFEKYGVEHIFQIDEIKNKIKETNLNRYGVEFPTQSDEIKNKIKNNNLIKYGVKNPSMLDSVKKKLKQTNLIKYGVDSVMKVKSIRNKLLDSKLNKFIIKNNIILDNIKIINNDNSRYLIKNQCTKHEEFLIDKNLFYHRVKYGVKNSCTICNPISKTSSIKENEIKLWLKNELKIKNIIENDRKILKNKEIDILLPDHDLGIEFNGLYWHSNINIDNDYHLNKTQLANTKGIKLIHIFEDEWILKSDIVKSIIKNKVGLTKNKIFGRKCIIKEILSKDCREFLDKNHIQGYINSSIRIGLFYNNELVSLMTFGKKRKAMGSKSEEDHYEMYRFCNKLNTSVIGGASKLFKYFINNYKPKEIISYADRRYFDGTLYENLNFKFISSTKPNFWYFKKNTLTREYRFNYRKDLLIKKGFDTTKTAHEIMSENGYYWIYDCGNLKFEYINYSF